MEFCWVTLNVNDLEESLNFYCNLLDLKIYRRFQGGEGVEIAMLGKADQTKIELICNKHNQITGRNTGISLGFAVPSLDEAMKSMAANNVAITRKPFSPSPNIRFCFVQDPNGIDIQLVENK